MSSAARAEQVMHLIQIGLIGREQAIQILDLNFHLFSLVDKQLLYFTENQIIEVLNINE